MQNISFLRKMTNCSDVRKMIGILARLPVILLLTLPVVSSSSLLDRDDCHTWLVKSVCQLDAENSILLTNDPYQGCPEGSTVRKMQAGDSLPYNNIDMFDTQMCDSVVLVDVNGNDLLMHTFDYAPFNEFNQHSGSDGYDIYMVKDGLVSITNTKDGGGYGSTFYSTNCQFGGGWALFPSENFLSGSQAYYPISGVYWEQDGQEYSGKCPTGYSTDTLTSWELVPDFKFGGVNGKEEKVMDTLISYHGYETADGITPTTNFVANGHLEVFYMTEHYGLTRWEVWVPSATVEVTAAASNVSSTYATLLASRAPSRRGSISSTDTSASCNGEALRVYKTMSFTVSDCHDWSQVLPVISSTATSAAATSSSSSSTGSDSMATRLRGEAAKKEIDKLTDGDQAAEVVPAWPLVNANLLQHFHFDSGLSEENSVQSPLTGTWHRDGKSVEGNILNWSILTSVGASDANNGAGTKYLAINCGGTCDPSGSQTVYQDIPISGESSSGSGDSSVCFDCTYLFGANARLEDSTNTASASITLALQLIAWPDASPSSTSSSSNSSPLVEDRNSSSLSSSRSSADVIATATILWQESVTENIMADNGDGRGLEADSVYLSSKFIHRSVRLPSSAQELLAENLSALQDNIQQQRQQQQHTDGSSSSSRGTPTLSLRFLIIPNESNTFHIVDAFVNRFPSLTAAPAIVAAAGSASAVAPVPY